MAAAVLVAAAGALVAAPTTARVLDATSLAPAGAVGYVVCPTAVTPVELDTRTAEAPIPLPLRGTPVLGSFAIATSPDGRWAYVATTDGVAGSVPDVLLPPRDGPPPTGVTRPSVASATSSSPSTS